MLEEYLKRLESLITPRSFSLTNFNDKSKGGPKQSMVKTSNLETQPDTNAQFNTNISSNQQLSDVAKQRLQTSDGEILPDNFREIVHQLKVKNMNYRHDIHLLKQKIEKYEKDIENKDSLIKKLQKQKEDDNKYLLRLEGVRAKDGVFVEPVAAQVVVEKKSVTPVVKEEKENKMNMSRVGNFFSSPSVNQNQSAMFLNESNLNVSGMTTNVENLKGLNLNDKKSVKEFALKLMSENKKLKTFQSKIYEVSKNYDTLNERITNGLRLIKRYFEDISSLNTVEGSVISNLAGEYDKILESLNQLIVSKQNEYNYLIENKSIEAKLYSDELTKFKQALELNKKDRFRDLKIISELEKSNEYYLEKINKLENQEKSDRKALKLVDIEQKMSPVKESMKKFIKRFEETFDLSDKKNIKLMEKLNDTLS